MKPGPSSHVTAVLSEVRKKLGTSKAYGAEQGKKEAKHLPRDVKRSLSEMEKVEQAAKYQPYLLDGQRKALERAKKTAMGYAEKETNKEDRSASRKQWFAGLMLNYLVFLILLAGFWYLGTRV